MKMDGPQGGLLRVGEWCVNPATGQISRNGESVRVEERTMRLLLCLAERTGEVVSIEELLNTVWPEVNVSPDSVYQAVASLRKLLGDDPKQPAYIATVPRLGYRMVAAVGTQESSEDQTQVSSAAGEISSSTEIPTLAAKNAARMGHPGSLSRSSFPGLRPRWVALALLCLFIVVLVSVRFRGKADRSSSSSTSASSPALAAQSQRSIAVLPFLDLTEGMKEEEFADGMTEELIDKLSKIPNLQVPAPTASFYFKGKQIPVAEIAKSLGVMYVLDGSVRKSGGRVRVAARLVRAENGYVVWAETYERPLDDLLMVQDDIAGEVTKALRASIEGEAGSRSTPSLR